MRWLILFLITVLVVGVVDAQTGRTEPAEVRCPSVLGIGINTDRTFCDVLTGQDPTQGIIVEIPPHRGTASLSFNLYNRHTYSADEVQAGLGYTQYTATILLTTLDSSLLVRAVVAGEFRTEADLVDRVGGGAGPGGVKAVAPIGWERITVTIPQGLHQVSILGESLDVVRIDGRQLFNSPGRPIAIISDVQTEYQPS